VSGIDTPILRSAHIQFFVQPVFDTPILGSFISLTAVLVTKLTQRAEICFQDWLVDVTLLPQNNTGVERTLEFSFSCVPCDWRLSPLMRLCSSSLPPLSSFECLEVYQDPNHFSQYVGDVENT
jgi:hypothetical protein